MARKRYRLRIEGIVQGVGFRPAVWRYATALGLAGRVWNEGAAVLIEVEGREAALERFCALLSSSPPPLARIARMEKHLLEVRREAAFTIDSSAEAASDRHIAPDMATCDACVADTFNPRDRRYRYPFTNCTNCGPRYTIIRDLPYDRPRTSMASFPMCPDCKAEYENPADRRFHAQPVACPRCGPSLRYEEPGLTLSGEAALKRAVACIQQGKIVAVKGLGGYHLACLADDQAVVNLLRERKRRQGKPFAVMVPDLAWAKRIAEVNRVSEALLASPQRPIVIVPVRFSRQVLPEGIAPGLRCVGLFLPYTPLHALLLAELNRPLVMTSANVSEEPICYQEEEARQRLSGIADAFLHHDRAIVRRCEDSVATVIASEPVVVRRSRGYAPAPVVVGSRSGNVILAVGGHLKNTFCFLRGSTALIGPHIGDLQYAGAFEQFRKDVEDFARLLRVEPRAVAHDLHPDYLTTQYAQKLPAEVAKIPIQHHHAHVVSCMAEHRVSGPVLGVAFDGLGMGLGEELWGGEFLLAWPERFERLCHLKKVLLPGGERAVREGWRVACACLYELGGMELLLSTGGELLGAGRVRRIAPLLEKHFACVPISSAGRLFDCVAALCALAGSSSYEGEAAARLEQQYRAWVPGPDYRFEITGSSPPFELSYLPCIEQVLRDCSRGLDPRYIATRFHRGLADAIRRVCCRLRDLSGVNVVALSGGVFHNKVLSELASGGLLCAGFRVLRHREVPPGDGGLCLGQALAADAILARGEEAYR